MKKLSVVLIIAIVIISCNNSDTKTTSTATDSITAAESPLMDAVNTADSAKKIIRDSTIKIMDTTIKK